MGQYLPELILPVTSANCKSLTALLPLCWDRAEVDDPPFTSDEPASLRLINILLPSKHSKLGSPRESSTKKLPDRSTCQVMMFNALQDKTLFICIRRILVNV